jgi:hypothetical protein
MMDKSKFILSGSTPNDLPIHTCVLGEDEDATAVVGGKYIWPDDGPRLANKCVQWKGLKRL